MYFQVFGFLFATLLLNDVSCLTRTEIRDQLQPTLLRLRDLSNTKYQQTNRQYTTLNDLLKKHLERSRNSTQTTINNLKNVISTAQKSATVTAQGSSCLKTQEAAASKLSTSTLTTCNSASNTNLTALSSVKSRFATIATVASYTVAWCTNLNPLDTQLETYRKCLADKIPDLSRQINIIGREYEELSNNTLHSNVKCLTDNAGAILGQISAISYEINVCLFTPFYY